MSRLSRRAVVVSLILPSVGLPARAAELQLGREPAADEVKVIIYRVPAGVKMRTFMLKIDGVQLIDLEEWQHSWIFLKPGIHTFTVAAPWDLEPWAQVNPITVNLEGGKTYFFQAGVRRTGAGWGGGAPVYTFGVTNPAAARAEMAPTRYRPLRPGFEAIGAVDR